jgi:uncharacterized protein YdhG (YjbR/CyaY superfamily)
MPAKTVAEYLNSLPADRRAALEAVRAVILKNIDKTFRECVQYGMIGYAVPHEVFPAGYHCDPKQPLPFAGLASQKGHMSLYMMALYMNPENDKWFRQAWAKSGKKLDMGKACIRFKKLEDVPLDVIGEAFKRLDAKSYIATYEANLAQGSSSKTSTSSVKKPSKRAPKKAASKKTTRKVAKKVRA